MASRPAAHWGTFKKQEQLNSVLSLVWSTVSGNGFEVKSQPSVGNPLVIGINQAAMVFVSCAWVGDHTWVVVAAFSDDSATAERYRNQIREQIVKSRPID